MLATRFEFRRSRRRVLSRLSVTLPYGIAFCGFFVARRSTVSLDLLVLQAILASLDDGIDFIVDLFYDVAISGFDASSDACFALGAEICTNYR